jgi:hypothetical protein
MSMTPDQIAKHDEVMGALQILHPRLDVSSA